MEYTKVEQFEHREQLVEALRSGRYSQGGSVLKHKNPDGAIQYCVMGVACEESGLGTWLKYPNHGGPYLFTLGDQTSLVNPPNEVSNYYGFSCNFTQHLVFASDSGFDFLRLSLEIEALDSNSPCEPPCGPDACTRWNGQMVCRLDFGGEGVAWNPPHNE